MSGPSIAVLIVLSGVITLAVLLIGVSGNFATVAVSRKLTCALAGRFTSVDIAAAVCRAGTSAGAAGVYQLENAR